MQKTYIHITTFLFIILFCGNVFSQQDNPANIGTGTIKGRVADFETNEPIKRVTLLLQGTHYEASTDFDGNYKITNVPPGTYTMQVTKVAYKTVIVDSVVITANNTLVFNLTLIGYKIGGDGSPETILVPPDDLNFGIIQGNVTDIESNKNIADAFIHLVGTQVYDVSDKNGNYTIKFIKPDLYKLRISKIDHITEFFSNIIIKAKDTLIINVKLKPLSRK